METILKEGACSEESLVQAVGDRTAVRKALTKLNRAKALTKRTYNRDDDTIGFEWVFMNPDRWRGKGTSQILEEVFGEQQKALVYGKYMELEATLTLTRPSLSGTPGTEDKTLVFRRVDGHVWLPSGSFAAMLRDAARLTDGLPERTRKSLERWIYFEDVLLDVTPSRETVIAPEGRGILSAEALPAGTKIPVKLRFPSSQVTAEQVLDALHLAGTFIGYSIAKSKQGWGRFEVQ